MTANTKIEWVDHTFNPWIGCTKVGPGCDHCYAEDWSKRYGIVQWGAGMPRRRTRDANWRQPLKWNAHRFMQCGICGWRGHVAAELIGCGACGSIEALEDARARVFCASLADVFDNEVPTAWRVDLFRLIEKTPNIDWLLLTKRIGNAERLLDEAGRMMPESLRWPMPNVWLGITVVNQEEADRDIPKLLAVPAHKRFLSIEPMLGPIDARKWLPNCYECSMVCGYRVAEDGVQTMCCEECGELFGNEHRCQHCESNLFYFECPKCASPLVQAHPCTRFIDWIIAGGESGPHARPAHPDWFRILRDQCKADHVPFFFKQWGEWVESGPLPGGDLGGDMRRGTVQHMHGLGNPEGYFRRGDAYVRRVGKKSAGRRLDGVEHNAVPG